MRNCPVCTSPSRTLVWSMGYKHPDGWPLPDLIGWCKCNECGMLYGDGEFDQVMYDRYYRELYGYGINSTEVNLRLVGIADDIAENHSPTTRFVDFGGSGDDGKSICVERLKEHGFTNAYNVNAGEPVPDCDILLASHVLEHVVDMQDVMTKITQALDVNGLLIVDGPDSTGIALHWGMPMLDFHTKHVNHFRMIDYLNLMQRWGFEMVDHVTYVDVRSHQTAFCYRMYFRRVSMAELSMAHVVSNIGLKMDKLAEITEPVNIWGVGDIAWHMLSMSDIEILDYIDNDPAMIGATIDGKPIVQAPTNDAPIIIVAQGQRSNLLNRIREQGITNEVIEI
jgi:hypothetical protein